MSTNFYEYLSKQKRSAEQPQKVASLRPTLYIGLGGFGCNVVRQLKEQIRGALGAAMEGFVFLGLDTHARENTDELSMNEYLPLSIGVNPTTVAQGDKDHLGWYTKVMRGYEARNIAGGANTLKPVGRLAFRYGPTFTEYINRLTAAANHLASVRDEFVSGAKIKVYIISSLAGGTGSGSLLDVMAVTGKFFRDRAGADFPYQAILVPPDVLEGEAAAVSMPDLYANTYASLKEAHHFFTSSEEVVVNYDDSNFRGMQVCQTVLPAVLHLVGNTNEVGDLVVDNIQKLGDLVVAYLMSEIQTPMNTLAGQPKVQDLENQLNTALGVDGFSPRCFSSFGVVRAGLPADKVSQVFLLHLVLATLKSELAEPDGLLQRASEWVKAHGLAEADSDDVQDRIKQNIRDSLLVTTDTIGVLMQKGAKLDDLVARAKAFVDDMRRQIDNEKKPLIESEAAKFSAAAVAAIETEFQGLLQQKTLVEATGFLRKLQQTLKIHQTSLTKEANSVRANLAGTLERQLQESVDENIQNSIPGLFGRERRVRSAVDDFGVRLEKLLNTQIDLWIKEKAGTVYTAVLEKVAGLIGHWDPAIMVLKGHQTNVEKRLVAAELELNRMADVTKRGPGNRFSLVDGEKVRRLYADEIGSEEPAVVRRIRNEWLEHDRLSDAISETESWVAGAGEFILDKEINPRLPEFSFSAVVRKFYPGDLDRVKLFAKLSTLCSPLFNLNPNSIEPGYYAYWIMAVHPDHQDEFKAAYDKLLPGQGSIFAFLDTPNEVVLYQLKMGYTIHSYRALPMYERAYNLLQNAYLRAAGGTKKMRPVHCWPEAMDWESLVADTTVRDTLRLFVLGRAFDRLFPAAGAPTADGQSGAKTGASRFISNRGQDYQLLVREDDEKPTLIGNDLGDALANLESHRQWQNVLDARIREKVDEVGPEAIRKRLSEEYLPEVQAAIADARKQTEVEQDVILSKLCGALRDYIDKLKASRI
jgi:hypothetical protein